MSCQVLTAERLEALLAGQLEEDVMPTLRAHLAEPCEACLERLESAEGERIVRALAGPAARLSPEEADRMFAAAVPRRPSLRSLVPLVPLALAAGLAMFFVNRGPAPSDRLKGPTVASPVSVELSGFRATVENGVPRVGERLEGGARLGAGERALFRYRLDRSAFLYWMVEHTRGREILLSPADDAEATAAGEHELSAEGQALALDPSLYEAPLRVVLIACAARERTAWVQATPADGLIARGCGRATLALTESPK